MKKYLIFRPGYPGFIWAEITADGKTENVIVHNIIHAMKRGLYTKKGYDLLLVPDTRNSYGLLTAKKKDCVKLGHLFAPKKNRGSDKGLISLTAENRFKGRDWEADRPAIERMHKSGFSQSQMAKQLGVSPSTLSKANSRLKLYPPKTPPCK
jgi:hypothetical protein